MLLRPLHLEELDEFFESFASFSVSLATFFYKLSDLFFKSCNSLIALSQLSFKFSDTSFIELFSFRGQLEVN